LNLEGELTTKPSATDDISTPKALLHRAATTPGRSGLTSTSRPQATSSDVQIGSYSSSASIPVHQFLEITLTPGQISVGVLKLRLSQTRSDQFFVASRQHTTTVTRLQPIMMLLRAMS